MKATTFERHWEIIRSISISLVPGTYNFMFSWSQLISQSNGTERHPLALLLQSQFHKPSVLECKMELLWIKNLTWKPYHRVSPSKKSFHYNSYFSYVVANVWLVQIAMVMHCSNQLSWCRPSWAGQHCHVIFDPLWSLNQTISSPLQQSTLCWCNASWSQRSWFMVIHHHNLHPELSSIYHLKNNWNCNLNAVTKCRLSILTQGLLQDALTTITETIPHSSSSLLPFLPSTTK